MASLMKDRTKRWVVQFYRDHQRGTVRLGDVPKRIAHDLKGKIESPQVGRIPPVDNGKCHMCGADLAKSDVMPDTDLQHVIAAWGDLNQETKNAIIRMIKGEHDAT